MIINNICFLVLWFSILGFSFKLDLDYDIQLIKATYEVYFFTNELCLYNLLRHIFRMLGLAQLHKTSDIKFHIKKL